MNVFDWLVLRDWIFEKRLGLPLRSEDRIARRMNLMAEMTGGKGFRTYPADQRTDSQGRTRGQRKRAAHAALFLKGE